MKTFFITTLGCKVNHYESDGIACELSESGWHRLDHPQAADIIIVNTCAVTSRAGMQSRQAIRSLVRSNTRARIIVTGCHAQTAPELIAKIPGVHHILGHRSKTTIARTLLSSVDTNSTQASDCVFPETMPLDARIFQSFKPAVTGGMTRAYLKIQDGCDAFCSYCIVPYARGRSASMPVKHVLDHLVSLDRAGYREVILTGIHVGAYGHDLDPPTTLAHLLKIIIDKHLIKRFRLSSIEPMELTDDILDLAQESSLFCDHFHIPLQNGDNDVLRRMKRPYTTEYFRDLVHRIRHRFPAAGIGVDLMMGFPGETDQAFQRTLALVQELPLTYLHVFPFSARPGTEAYDFKDKIKADIIKSRCAIIRSVGDEKKRSFELQNIGKNLGAVVQHSRDKSTGLLKAITSNYLSVLVNGQDLDMGHCVDVRIDGVNTKGKLTGTLV